MSLLLGNPPLSPGNPITNGLTAFYKLDEASGLRFDTLVPGMGPAAKFTRANSERLVIADNADLSAGDIDFTVGCCVRVDAATDSQTAIGKFLATGNQREYRLTFRTSGSNHWAWSVSPDGTLAAITSVDSGAVTIGEWHFVLAEHDAARNELRIRINNGAPTIAAYSGGIFDGTAGFSIGSDHSAGTNHLDGAVKMAFVAKGLLTDAQLSELWNGGRGTRYARLPPSITAILAAWWEMDEPSGNRADSHGSNTLTDTNTVTLTEGPQGNSLADVNTVTSAAGKVGNAAVFAAANSEQLVGAHAAEIDSGDTTWEWNGWAYLETTTADMTLLAKDTGAAGGRAFRLSYDNSSDVFRWEVFDGTNVIGTVDAADLGAPADDTWYFVRVWHSATGNEVGIEIDRGTADTAATTGAASSGTTAAFRMGANGSGSPDYLNGRLDEWGKWSRILGSAEADERYAAGSPTTGYPF